MKRKEGGMRKLETEIKDLSHQELKELILVNMYKMSLMRAQIEALTKVLIREKLTDYEEIWKETNEHFNDSV